ncbi:MAG TPA: transposase domain-containing protein [Acidobacteriota bacterium]|nr:transposase domain-containing protein [Acidobacteriota bacterium]
MAWTVADLSSGTPLMNYISPAVLTKTFPVTAIEAVLRNTGRMSIRQRDLPAHVVVYDVIAMALCMQPSYREVLRCLTEGIRWLPDPGAIVKVAGKSGISQAQTRLGWEPIQQLHDDVVKPIAVESTKGAWYRGCRQVRLDGSINEQYGKPICLPATERTLPPGNYSYPSPV